MSVKAETIRQAKKYLENKNLSIKVVKPRLFAKVSQEMGSSFDDLLETIQKELNNGTADSSDQETDKRV
jgi:hypothetical protein